MKARITGLVKINDNVGKLRHLLTKGKIISFNIAELSFETNAQVSVWVEEVERHVPVPVAKIELVEAENLDDTLFLQLVNDKIQEAGKVVFLFNRQEQDFKRFLLNPNDFKIRDPEQINMERLLFSVVKCLAEDLGKDMFVIQRNPIHNLCDVFKLEQGKEVLFFNGNYDMQEMVRKVFADI